MRAIKLSFLTNITFLISFSFSSISALCVDTCSFSSSKKLKNVLKSFSLAVKGEVGGSWGHSLQLKEKMGLTEWSVERGRGMEMSWI